MHRPSLLPVITIAVLAGCAGGGGPDCADLVLTAATIHTMDPERPQATSLAVADGRILAVGDEDLTEGHVCEGRTERIDRSDHTVVPGLIDAHGHVLNLGHFRQRVDLVGTRSFQEVLDRVAHRLQDAGPTEWILGRGWDQNDWPRTVFPTRDALDALAPQNPVLLERIDGHAVLANGTALDAAGITADTSDPEGGEILRYPDGRPTGVLVDQAANLAEAAVPEPTPAQKRATILEALQHVLTLGLTGVHDAGIDYDEWDLYRAMVDSGELPLRIYAMLGSTRWGPDDWFRRDPELGRGDGMLTVRTFKLYMDGALGSRGAALLDDYSDRAGHRGSLIRPVEEIEEVARRGLSAGFQVAVHAIGDSGNREALDMFARVLEDAPAGDYRPRIEHAQTLSLDDVGRFADLGVIPSMQPTHCTSDMPWVADRLGEERARMGYAWRSLLDAGAAHLALGSDFPVESANPFWGIYAAVTRQDREGHPAEGWNAHEALTPAEALRGFTADAAFAAFQEGEVGVLAPGSRADFVVVDRDPLNIPAAEILDTQVLETWLAGRRVYQRP
jgi:predicted amidohydrolase YtcJ